MPSDCCHSVMLAVYQKESLKVEPSGNSDRKKNIYILKLMATMRGGCRDFSGGDGTHPVEPERLN